MTIRLETLLDLVQQHSEVQEGKEVTRRGPMGAKFDYRICTSPDCQLSCRTTKHNIKENGDFECQTCGSIKRKTASARVEKIDPNKPIIPK